MTLAIVQARFGSSRLPGKVLERVGGITVLEHVVRRVQQAVPDVVVAVPNSGRDARVFECARSQCRVPAYMHPGEEDDVLSRFVGCAREHKASIIVRITADCPLLDPAMIALCVAVQQQTGAPYVSHVAGDPGAQVDGLDVEVFTRDMLESADQHATEREHVTTWMRSAGTLLGVTRRLPLPATPPGWLHRWTLDTPDDLKWMHRVADRLEVDPGRYSVWGLVRLLNDTPELVRVG